MGAAASSRAGPTRASRRFGADENRLLSARGRAQTSPAAQPTPRDSQERRSRSIRFPSRGPVGLLVIWMSRADTRLRSRSENFVRSAARSSPGSKSPSTSARRSTTALGAEATERDPSCWSSLVNVAAARYFTPRGPTSATSLRTKRAETARLVSGPENSNSVAVPGVNRELVSINIPVREIFSRPTSRPQGNLTVDSHGTSLPVRRSSRSC